MKDIERTEINGSTGLDAAPDTGLTGSTGFTGSTGGLEGFNCSPNKSYSILFTKEGGALVSNQDNEEDDPHP
jgi:hypothetical protein